jgi:uncharacterized SAM-binding protein YcdF (DUF218 family)
MRARLLRSLVRMLSRPLELRDKPAPADAIVVLGAPLRPDGRLSDVLEERVRAGVELWQRGLAPLLCMSGGRGPGVRAEIAEADAMAARARELGVPAAALVIEGESANTSKNAKNIAMILGSRGARRVLLVTQPFHLRRSAMWFRRAGLEVNGYWIADSLQYREAVRGLRWVGKEYLSLARDLTVTRRPGE